jgi:hypothetical protein
MNRILNKLWIEFTLLNSSFLQDYLHIAWQYTLGIKYMTLGETN